MKAIHKFNLYFFLCLGFALSTALTSCELDDLDDPNNPSVGGIEGNATLSELQNLVDGIQAGMRNNYNIYFDGVSVIGREIYRFSGSDPRYTGELMGASTGKLDPGAFYTVNPYTSRYRVIKNCNILQTAVKNTKAALTNEQRNGFNGFANTIKAHEMLMAFNQQYDNGIRIQVDDPNNLGAFLDKSGSLDGIIALLDEGSQNLQNGGTAFAFKLGRGFTGFSTPAEFNKFNRALAARVNAYRENWNGMKNALDASFINDNGDINTGVFYVFSKSGGDLLNEVFYPLNANGEVRLAHPSFIADAEAGDKRLQKVSKRTTPVTSNMLTAEYDFALYKTNTDNIPMIRNEELILLRAEYFIQNGQTIEALRYLNIIRNAAGLGNYSGASDKNGLINELLKQRRYSLYGECHRWIDARRYNQLGTLPIDRTGDDVWDKFPRPDSEQ